METLMQNTINIMRKVIVVIILLLTINVNGQGIFGKWESKNEKTGEVDSIIEVYENNGKAYAKIIEIKDEERQSVVCDLCEGDNKDQPILGMNILTGLEKDDDEWSGGNILDPRNGKVYKCYIKLVKPNKIKLRGYIGISLFGKTAYWYRSNQ
jgi:uncharacterized protein (DUF2147 family)